MSRRKKPMILGVLALFLSASAADADAPKPACDRACLDGYVDQYLTALVAHDPKRLPLTADARFTENGQTLKLGDALWGTIESLGSYRLTIDDPEQGEVGAFAVVQESGRPALLSLRLKLQAGKISQIETLVARKDPGGFAKPEDLKPKPIFTETLAPHDRPSRDALVHIANSYFEGLEQATGKLTPFDPTCTRIENGTVTANNPTGTGMAKLTCGGQFDTGFSKFITHVRERRFPAVDVERGLVFAVVFFDHAGTVKDVKMANGENLHVPPPFDAPYCFEINEVFKIRNGKITQIEAVLLTVPYGMKSGWAAGS